MDSESEKKKKVLKFAAFFETARNEDGKVYNFGQAELVMCYETEVKRRAEEIFLLDLEHNGFIKDLWIEISECSWGNIEVKKKLANFGKLFLESMKKYSNTFLEFEKVKFESPIKEIDGLLLLFRENEFYKQSIEKPKDNEICIEESKDNEIIVENNHYSGSENEILNKNPFDKTKYPREIFKLAIEKHEKDPTLNFKTALYNTLRTTSNYNNIEFQSQEFYDWYMAFSNFRNPRKK